MVILGYFLAGLVGLSLGMIGSGGSILTVPILVYIMGVDAVMATAYSLFIVGSTALVGGVQKAISKTVDFKTALIFGIPSIAAVYMTRLWLVPLIPNPVMTLGSFVVTKSIALLLLFAVVMIASAYSMIRPAKFKEVDESQPLTYNYPLILAEGILVGILTGLVGAGGGFLIIPALVLLVRMPMKRAVGTSLFIIASKSLFGFIGDLQTTPNMDWNLLFGFTLASIVGIIVGNMLSKKVAGDKLKVWFGWFVLAMGIFIIIKELFYT